MKILKLILAVFVVTLLFSQCKYNFIVPEEVTPPNPDGEPISYSEQVQTIFTAKCASCHKPGGTMPDLTAGNSYNQVVPGHVNLTTPAESDIYKFPAPSTSLHAWKKYSSNEAIIILTWIEEGANNN
ncbi:MAG TPA: hypothetical protein PLG30_13105 [Bacteroidia bacterium]|nr:hypothetical protein [Bacteroidia bacterium]